MPSMRDDHGSATEPGSFRDPSTMVFYRDQRVLRALDERALGNFRVLAATRLFSEATARGDIVATKEVSDQPPSGDWMGVLEHERVPFVSYPYEWTFSMMRDAALLQLQLLDDALDEDMTMKDATPYNLQFVGARPTFIDLGSFQRLAAGEPWVGYRQFCTQFLYPLMLRAYKDVPFGPWLRGRIDGVTPIEMRALLSRRDLRRPGVMLHVAMQARAERRLASTDRSVRRELKAAGFRKEMIKANLKGLRRTITRMRWEPASAWTGYASTCEHVEVDRPAKTAFVEEALERLAPRLVWDIGANDGHFSRIAARRAETVIAMDVDEPVVDRLYRSLRASGDTTILPLVADLADPSPGLGWEGRERRPLEQRGRPDLVLCLAVIHHLVIGRSIPVARFVDWLAGLGAAVVLEFVDRDDPMVQRLTLNRLEHELHRGYDGAGIRATLQHRFRIEQQVQLPSGHRTMFLLKPKR